MFRTAEERAFFHDKDGLQEKMGRISEAVSSVRTLSEEMLAPERQDEAISGIISARLPSTPVLRPEESSYKQTTKRRMISDVFGGRSEREVSVVEFHVPFAGDQDIFYMRPQTWTTTLPRGRLGRGELVIEITDSGNPAHMKQQFDSQIAEFEQYLSSTLRIHAA